MNKDGTLNYSCDINENCALILEGVTEDIIDKIYLTDITDITGVLGAWFDGEFDSDIPSEVIDLLQKAYTLATKELEVKHYDD